MKLYQAPEGLEQFQMVISKMAMYDIKRMRAEFYGGGDSGQIEDVEVDPTLSERVDMLLKKKRYCIDARENIEVEEVVTLEQGFEHLVYEWLDTTGVDWYNNEGGGGYFEITLEDVGPKIHFDVYYNEIVSTSAMSDELDIRELL